MTYQMVGCGIDTTEKIIYVYKDSYLSDKWRKRYEDEGYRIIEGGVKLDKYGNTPPEPFPLHNSKQTNNDVVELVKQSRNEDKDIRIVEGKE